MAAYTGVGNMGPRATSITNAALRLLVVFSLGFWLARAAVAWNSQGHMVVAQIAYNHLDPDVKAKCDALIAILPACGTASQTFVSDSTWADQRCEAGTAAQHYIDIPISLDGSPTNGVASDPTNVVAAIQQYVSILQDPAANVTNQSKALRYLIHFVGDIQQPLHCSTGVTASKPAGDAGGNSFTLNGTWSNLHSLWDAGGGYLNGGVVSNKAAEVEAAYPYTKSIGSIPNSMDWAWEGREIARTNCYVGITNGTTPTVSYTNMAQAVTKQRMAAGGQRLAKLLNTIFVTNTPVVAAATITNGNFSFSWSAVSGQTYRIQWKHELNDASWNDLADVTASTNSASFGEPPAGETQRFYRAISVN